MSGAHECRSMRDKLLVPTIIADIEANGGPQILAPCGPDQWIGEQCKTLMPRIEVAAREGTRVGVHLRADGRLVALLKKDLSWLLPKKWGSDAY